ncbi:hypothetical protein D9M72_478730 [compost metagenome]
MPGPVVMPGAADHRQPPGFAQRRIERLAEASRYDGVAFGHRDHHRAAEAFQAGRAVVAVAQHPAGRQPRIVMRGNMRKLVPRRDQQHAGDALALARRGRCGHARAQRLADQQQRAAELAPGQRDRLLRVCHEAALTQRAGARAVGRVLGQDHAKAQLRQRAGVVVAMPGVPGIAMKDHGGGARRAGRLGDQSAKVLRPRPGAQPGRDHVIDRRLVREVEEVILQHADSGKQD